MADNDQPKPTQTDATESSKPTEERPLLTRRDFFVRSNAGAVAVGMMTGTGFAATLIQAPAAPPKTAAPPKPAAVPPPLKTRRVTLDIDGKKYDVNADVRESLWETMNYQLGLSNCNLGCDRAQCGACAVLVDGRAVNACTLLTARYGRGQKILTVAGIATGPGPRGTRPLQAAFGLEGGFQCGICTRGFIMASYALLQTNKNPTTEQIKEALSGNICRCGEYPKIISSVKKAAAEMRGEKVSYTAPLITAEAVALSAAVENAVSKQFEFATPLTTIEQFDDLAVEFKQKSGIVGVAGSERTITPTWDPAKLDESRVRQIFSESGPPVK